MSLPNWDKQLDGINGKIKVVEEKLRKLKGDRETILAKKEAFENKELKDVMAKSNLSPKDAANILKEALQQKLPLEKEKAEPAKKDKADKAVDKPEKK